LTWLDASLVRLQPVGNAIRWFVTIRVSHIWQQLRVKSVIFSASDPNRWAPLDRDRHRVLSKIQSHPDQEFTDLTISASGMGGIGKGEVRDYQSLPSPQVP